MTLLVLARECGVFSLAATFATKTSGFSVELLHPVGSTVVATVTVAAKLNRFLQHLAVAGWCSWRLQPAFMHAYLLWG
jgi:hypothetical protein